MEKPSDLAFELPVYASIESPFEIKPHAYAADSTVEIFTVLHDNGGIVEQVNDLGRFRKAVMKVLVDALRKTRSCEEETGRYAWIKLWAGQEKESADKLEVEIERDAKGLWRMAWSQGKPSPGSRFRRQGGGLASMLRVFRVLLEHETAEWLSRVPFPSPT